MDNIFEILIYLFIIVSFLASLFKKKKPGAKSNQQTARPPLEPGYQPKSTQQEEYDILQEIEKMFKTETSSPGRKEERGFEKEERFEPASEHPETADWHQQSPEELKTTISEHAFANWEEKKKKTEGARKAINEKIVSQAQMFEKHLEKKKELIVDFKKILRQKFKEPKSLKEYIIFSEIYGKQKALQE